MTMNNDALARLAKSLGLEKIHAAQPQLVRQAHANARAMADRLERPTDISEEPSHVFRADNNV